MKALAVASMLALCSACQWISPQPHEQVYTSNVPEQGWTTSLGVDLEIFIPPMGDKLQAELQCRYSNAVDSSLLLLELTTIKGDHNIRSQSLSLPLYAQIHPHNQERTHQGIVYRTQSISLGDALDGLPAGVYTIRLRPLRKSDRIDGVSSLSIKISHPHQETDNSNLLIP